MSEVEPYLVSIITPVHNGADVLDETVQSILAQTYTNWELIMVDDASSDDSWLRLEDWKRKDKRIRIIQSKENVGAAKARNMAIEEAGGRFIAFLDSDDQWLPEKLEKQVAFSIQNEATITHTSYRYTNAVGQPIDKVIQAKAELEYDDMLDFNFIGCLTAMYDTKRTGGKVLMPEIAKRQDYALWLKIMRSGLKAYGMIEVLALYRTGRASLSSNKWDAAKYNYYLLTKIEGLPRWKAVYHFVRYFFIGFNKYFLS